MKQKLLSILALLLMTATGAWADITVTWTADDMKDPGIYVNLEYGEAFNNTIKGITVTASSGGDGYWDRNTIFNYSGSTTITFTSSVGKIKSIAITAADIMMSSTPSGWTTDYSKLSWSGEEASTTVSLPLSGETEIYNISEIVFTIESSTVNVTGITLDKTEASMIVGGETLTLTPTVAPNDATDKTVTWMTSDAGVATVANGVVTAVAAGTATITATATNGTPDDTSDDKTATCTVTVSNPTVTANPGGDGNYWSTYYNATKSFTADENTTVYKAALNGTSSVTLTEVAGREIPADQAVILKSTTGTITLTPATTTADLSDNVLKGGTTVTSGYDAYTLSRGSDGTGAVGFYKFNGSLDGNKAHLEIPTSAGTRSFIGFGDDNTTGIELPALADDEAAEWYSLDGRRLGGKPARKGIYVKDGQKYIIK